MFKDFTAVNKDMLRSQKFQSDNDHSGKDIGNEYIFKNGTEIKLESEASKTGKSSSLE